MEFLRRFVIFSILSVLAVSSAAIAATKPNPKPSAPTGLAAVLAYPEVQLSWNANPEPYVVGYNVYRSANVKSGFVKLNSSRVPSPSYADLPPTLNTTYYYKVAAVSDKDLEGPASTPVSIYFYDNAPPGPVTVFTAAAVAPSNAISLSWTNPTEADFTGTMVRWSLSGFPASPTSGSLLCNLAGAPGSNASFIHQGTMAGITYFYSAFAHDAVPNYSQAAQASATPRDTTPPVISNVNSTAWATTARITWATNERADSQVEYGTTTSFGLFSPLNSALAFTHQVYLTGLTPGTYYHYRVRSRDAAGNLGVSGDYTFTTPTPPDTTPPILSRIGTSWIDGVSAVIELYASELVYARVDYGMGTTPIFGRSVPSLLYSRSHAISLSSLTPDRFYHYQVTAQDAAGNATASSLHTFRTVGPVVAECLICHDGSGAVSAADFAHEGHGKGDVNLVCLDCHVDHQAAPAGYKYLKTVNGYSFPSPYTTGPWQSAMYAQRAFCEVACHPPLPPGYHPVADDPVSRYPDPYVWFIHPDITFLPGPDLPLFDADGNNLQSTHDIVMCDSCHSPHGRLGYKQMKRDGIGYDAYGLCVRCHPF